MAVDVEGLDAVIGELVKGLGDSQVNYIFPCYVNCGNDE